MSDTNIIVMAKQRDPFARVAKSLLSDSRISWRTKGVMAYLLGKPSGWKLRVSDLVNKSTDGKHSVRMALNEAREAGYAELSAIRKSGVIVEWVWKISDSPIFKKPDTKNQTLDVSPDTDSPEVVNRYHSKNDGSKKGVSRRKQEAPPLDVTASDLPPNEEHPARPKGGESRGVEARGSARVGGAELTGEESARSGGESKARGSLKSSRRVSKRIALEKAQEADLSKWDTAVDPREIDRDLR